MKKIKVFMKSGNVIELKCEQFKAVRLNDGSHKSLETTKCPVSWSIDMTQVEAIVEVL